MQVPQARRRYPCDNFESVTMTAPRHPKLAYNYTRDLTIDGPRDDDSRRVGPTLELSCEPVRPSVCQRAHEAALPSLPGAAERFVSFNSLLDRPRRRTTVDFMLGGSG